MLLTEYNEAETMEMLREEGRAEGRAEMMMELERRACPRGGGCRPCRAF